MVSQVDKQRPSSLLDDYLLTWVEAFIIDRKARGHAKGTVGFYVEKLGHFTDYAEAQAVKRVTEITPALIREYLLFLERKHNPGGVHAHFRTLRTFLFWWEEETEPDNYKNPIRKVKAPKLAVQPIEGVTLETVKKLVCACKRNTFTGDRDAAIFYCLFDTGARAGEFLKANLEDVNHGEILIRKGKGRKPRYVYIGRTARKALRKYLKHRHDSQALWVTRDGERLSYSGLRGTVTRAAKRARITAPALHDFRRGFALAMLRNGTDVYTLAKLMGHAGIEVLQRYLRLTDADAETAHRRASPVDNLF